MVVINNTLLQTRIESEKLVAIIRTSDVDSAVAVAQTLFSSGILVLEITLTIKDALKAIEQVVSFAPKNALVGAGTVISNSQLDQCLAAGAQYIVTPTMSEAVGGALSQDVGVLAGAFSPTEIQSALDAGVAAVKLFPATSLGPSFIRAFKEPFPKARIIPVGGVGLSNIEEFMASGAMAVGVGGSLIGDCKTVSGDHDALMVRAKAFLAKAQGK
jgi:2-dehydro-3-deoxyphosphogluconate aldolase / (4S)-4-hydroxy-2-oxoglutarate aldolase